MVGFMVRLKELQKQKTSRWKRFVRRVRGKKNRRRTKERLKDGSINRVR